MPRKTLTDRMLKSNLAPGRYYDNQGTSLHIYVRKSGLKSWVQRLRINGVQTDLGLGTYPQVSLKDARRKAVENKAMASEGKDPRHAIAKPKQVQTFSDVAAKVIKMKAEELSNAKHKAQWATTLETYVFPTLGNMPIDQIDVGDVLAVLEPIWTTKHETASRVRGRIEAVFDYAIALKLRQPPNPAAWKGNLSALLPKANPKQRHHPALQLSDLPRWWKGLSTRDGMGAQALQFLTLTAARSGEIRNMTWPEIQTEKRLWIIPADRMKAGREHRVPLTAQMEALLDALPRSKTTDLVFPSSRATPLSDMTLSATMKRMHASDIEQGGPGFVDPSSGKPAVPHGLRSSFRDWAAEKGYESDMAEIQLAHSVGTEVTRAYLRTDMLEKRRAMLEDWGRFLSGD